MNVKLMQRTMRNGNERRTLRLRSYGFEITRERPRVGGGWYVRDGLVMPWPWSSYD